MKTLWLAAASATALILPAAALATPVAPQGCADLTCHTSAILADPGAGDGHWTSTEAPRYGTWGFDLAARDTSVTPGDDFFRYANGAAFDALLIPSDRTSYGSFNLLSELSENRMKALVDEMAGGSFAAGTDEARVAALYRSFADQARIDQLDAAPFQPVLAEIRAATTREAIARYMGHTQADFGGAFYGAYVGADAKSPQENAVYLVQGGIGLPDRDYYLTDRFATQKAAYQAYIAQMLGMIGWADAEKAAADIVAMETRIAEGHWSRTESRDDDKTYNPMTRAELVAANPGFDWNAFFEGAGMGSVDRFVVSQNTAFPKIAQVFAETPVETLQAWQAFRSIDQAAPYMSQRFSDAQWTFRSHVLSGAPEQRSRDKRAVAFAQGSMGEALGRAYVARWFPPESKAAMDTLVQNIRLAMANRIRGLDWMSDATKARALEKLEKFRVKIGYPVKWLDYSSLDVREDDLFGNARRVSAFDWKQQLDKIGKPVDRDEWGMTPQTVNAYYSSTGNEIVFPAAILQPPFFDASGDPAVNYGGIGGVIGHEIGHGFDDQGRKSDGDGVLAEWWTPEDESRFEAQTARLGAQYDAFELFPGRNVQGAMTMGENIGDLAGVTLALEAYHLSLNGQPAPVLDGTTGDQRVFYGWAQVWRSKYREADAMQRLATDVHAPARFRVIGPLRNVDAWYTAFDVQPGSKYYLAPEDRVRLW